MGKEAEEAGERTLDSLKQQVFASAFGSFDPKRALTHYYDVFEKAEEKIEYEVEEFEPQNEGDIQEMINTARRAGVIS